MFGEVKAGGHDESAARTHALRTSVLEAALALAQGGALSVLVKALVPCVGFPGTVAPPRDWEARLRSSLASGPPLAVFNDYMHSLTRDPVRGARAAIERACADGDADQRALADCVRAVFADVVDAVEVHRVSAITKAVGQTLAAAAKKASSPASVIPVRERIAAVMAAAGAIVPGTVCGRRTVVSRATSDCEEVEPQPLAGVIVRSAALDALVAAHGRAVAAADGADALTRVVLGLAGADVMDGAAEKRTCHITTELRRAEFPELAARSAILEATIVAVCAEDRRPLAVAVENARCYPEALLPAPDLYAAGFLHSSIRAPIAWEVRPAFTVLEAARAAAELARCSGDDSQRDLANAVLPRLAALAAVPERRA